MKTPREIAEERLLQADQYAKLGERLAGLKLMRAKWWQAHRDDYKSDASANRYWDLKKEGQEMETINLKMKAKMFKISALKTLLQVAQAESFNQY